MKTLTWLLMVFVGAGAGLATVGAERNIEPHSAEALARAMTSVQKATDRVKNDPARPQFHFLPPAQWMNDPNGPIYHKGWYHMFYQHNPYADNWGHMHWGHARSRDLVKWEHLPIALWPSLEAGEEHVFSGCSLINHEGNPMIFYTSIHKGKSAGVFAEQWAAVSDAAMLNWRKLPNNPAMDESLHGKTKIYDWRDPFYFRYRGQDFMVLGGNLNEGKGGQAIVALYKAEDNSLMKWKYEGTLFEYDKAGNIECPNFFELDGKWVLVISPHRRVEYFVGKFDGKKFTPETQGLMDHSDNYYAPNCTVGAGGRRMMWGWIRGFKEGQGWNGALTLPRELRLTGGELRQRPAEELEKLRTQRLKVDKRGSVTRVENNGSAVELRLRVEGREPNARLVLSDVGDPRKKIELTVANNELEFRGTKIALPKDDQYDVRVFYDKSVIEVYVDDTFAISKVQYEIIGTPKIELFPMGRTRVNAEAWNLNTIW